MIEPSATFCTTPYQTLQIKHANPPRSGLALGCCCNLDRSVFVPSTGTDIFSELKQQQAQGQWPAACRPCNSIEQDGKQSERMINLITRKQDVPDILEHGRSRNFEIMVKFSNRCPLACRMCNSHESSGFAKLAMKTHISDHYSQDLSDNPEHWKFITDQILHLHDQYEEFRVHLMGGESIIQAGALKLIDWMIDLDIAKKISIAITTSLAVNMPERFIERLRKFKFIAVIASIDSVGKNYEYLRWPAKFEKVESNLTEMLSNLNTDQFYCTIHVVFGINNFFYMKEIIDYWYDYFQELGRGLDLYIYPLNQRTRHLDVMALPDQYRSTLADKLEQCLAHQMFVDYPFQSALLKETLLKTVDILKNKSFEADEWRRFVEHTTYFDKKTNMRFSEHNQHLYSMLTDQHQQQFNNMFHTIDINSPLRTA